MDIQTYEDYWRFTNAYTDYNGSKFLTALRFCVEFIDEFENEEYSEEKYARLQSRIEAELNINLISIRKGINQLVKMGFINSYLVSYNLDSIDYLNATTNRKRQSILSKIVYTNSSFNRAVNEESDLHQLNFLIKSLVENGKLNESEIIALMLVDIASIEKGFLTNAELIPYVQAASSSGFIERKYNQIGYLFNLLTKLDDIIFVEDELYFYEDAKIIFGDELNATKKVRDPYLHSIFKNQLKEESLSNYGYTLCMLEKLEYPVLIASHIKPFIKSDESEAYDVNNGLLLSKNTDSLFDLGYITFDNSGTMAFSASLPNDVKEHVSQFHIDAIFLNDKRKQYLNYHRNEVFDKRFKTKGNNNELNLFA